MRKYSAEGRTISNTKNPLIEVLGGIGESFQSLGDTERIFADLVQYSPDSIRTSVEAIRDSLKTEEQQVGAEDPTSPTSILTTLFGGIENSLESSGAWTTVGDYVKNTCHVNVNQN